LEQAVRESPVVTHLMWDTRRIGEIRRKRYIVAFDHVKTLCFGFIGAACISPLVNQSPFTPVAYATIVFGGGILVAMIIWPGKMR
jgi:hypothetical protein